MLARAVAVLRNHPLFTPLLVIYGAMNLLAVAFAFGLSNLPINLVLLVVYVSVIRLATRDRPTAVTAVHRPDARSRDIGFAVTGAGLQCVGVAVVWVVSGACGLGSELGARLRAGGGLWR